jgi:hypothetical protein
LLQDRLIVSHESFSNSIANSAVGSGILLKRLSMSATSRAAICLVSSSIVESDFFENEEERRHEIKNQEHEKRTRLSRPFGQTRQHLQLVSGKLLQSDERQPLFALTSAAQRGACVHCSAAK